METLIHADIFFFITTIAVALVTVGIVIALAYLIKILRNVSEVSEKVKEEGAEILEDIHTMRHDLKRDGFRFRFIKNFFARLFRRKKKSE
jgi:uncharacterized protein (UPF0335 family)